MAACVWVSIVSRSGLPLLQCSRDGITTPFAVEGLLCAMQSSAGLGPATINTIATESATIAYDRLGEMIIIGASSASHPHLARSTVRNVRGCLTYMNGSHSAADITIKELRHKVMRAKSLIGAIVDKADVAFIGIPGCVPHRQGPAYDQLLSLAASISDRVAIYLRDSQLVYCTPGWNKLDRRDLSTIALAMRALPSEPVRQMDIHLWDSGKLASQEATMIIVQAAGVNVLVAVARTTAASEIAKMVEEIQAYRDHVPIPTVITVDPGIEAFLCIHQGRFMSFTLGADLKQEKARCLALHLFYDEYCVLHERGGGQRDPSVEAYSVNEDDTGTYTFSEGGDCIHFLLSADVPRSCWSGLVRLTLKEIAAQYRICSPAPSQLGTNKA